MSLIPSVKNLLSSKKRMNPPILCDRCSEVIPSGTAMSLNLNSSSGESVNHRLVCRNCISECVDFCKTKPIPVVAQPRKAGKIKKEAKNDDEKLREAETHTDSE